MKLCWNCTADLSGVLSVEADYLPKLESKLFFEGDRATKALVNFWVMLALATVIATFGILSDSAVTVVGAMLMAPLMTPIMATSVALVGGNFERAMRSLLLVTAGSLGVVLLSLGLSVWLPSVAISFSANQEIASRASPGVLALLLALASGAAGAFAVAREEISDALPGIAIAISLEPPLSVVGIALGKGDVEAAEGAGLLFLTNFVAILVTGGFVLSLMGLNRADISPRQIRLRHWAFAIVALGTLLVVVPLALTARSVLRADLDQWSASGAVRDWLADRPADLLSVAVSDSTVIVSVASAEHEVLDQGLVDALAKRLGRRVNVRLRVVPEQRYGHFTGRQAPTRLNAPLASQ
jgi:uncharacterized hydrophobic protein (TIGR00271 family)